MTLSDGEDFDQVSADEMSPHRRTELNCSTKKISLCHVDSYGALYDARC